MDKKPRYYSLQCLQNGNYMATGRNSTSLKQLTDDYVSYKSIDWNDGIEEGEKTMEEIWSKLTIKEKLEHIGADEFEIIRHVHKLQEDY